MKILEWLKFIWDSLTNKETKTITINVPVQTRIETQVLSSASPSQKAEESSAPNVSTMRETQSMITEEDKQFFYNLKMNSPADDEISIREVSIPK